MQSQHFSAVGGFNGYFMVVLKHHISTKNVGTDFLATSTFQNFLRGWGHAGGILGASILRAWACFRALKLLTS